MADPTELEPCREDQFNRTIGNLDAYRNMDERGVQLLCPKSRDGVTIRNFYNMPEGQLYRLSIEKCDPGKYSGCETD